MEPETDRDRNAVPTEPESSEGDVEREGTFESGGAPDEREDAGGTEGAPGSEEAASGEDLDEDLEVGSRDDFEGDDEDAEEGDEETLGTTSEIENLGPCKKRIRAAVPRDRVREHLDRSYEELTTTVTLPGFRRGRVPRRLLERRYGEEVESDVKEVLLAESFAEVVRENELRLLGSPRFEKVEFRADDDLRYEAEVQVHPEFELPEYKGVAVERRPVRIEEARVDAELESLRRGRAKLAPVDPAEAGAEDHFSGSYKLFAGDVEVKEQRDVEFVPQSGRIEAFELADLPQRVASWDRSQAGTTEGEPLRAEVTVPDSYPDEVLRNRQLRLEFRLQATKTRELPELDDAFAERLGSESLEALRVRVREELTRAREREEEKRIEREVIDRLLDSLDLELPEDLIERQRTLAEEQIEQEMLAAGKSEEEIAAERTRAGEKAASELKRELKEFFLLERIAEAEKIFATEEEVRNRVQLMAMVYGMSPMALVKQLQESGRLEEIRMTLRNEKVRTYLRKRAKVAEGESPAAPEGAPAGETEPETEAPASGSESETSSR